MPSWQLAQPQASTSLPACLSVRPSSRPPAPEHLMDAWCMRSRVVQACECMPTCLDAAAVQQPVSLQTLRAAPLPVAPQTARADGVALTLHSGRAPGTAWQSPNECCPCFPAHSPAHSTGGSAAQASRLRTVPAALPAQPAIPPALPAPASTCQPHLGADHMHADPSCHTDLCADASCVPVDGVVVFHGSQDGLSPCTHAARGGGRPAGAAAAAGMVGTVDAAGAAGMSSRACMRDTAGSSWLLPWQR